MGLISWIVVGLIAGLLARGTMPLAWEATARVLLNISKEAEEALENRATALEGILGMRPQARVVVGDAPAAIEEAAEESSEPTIGAVERWGLGAVRRLALGQGVRHHLEGGQQSGPDALSLKEESR